MRRPSAWQLPAIPDFAASETYDLKDRMLRRVLEQPLTENAVPALKEEIDRAGWLLYIADNAGETVFDRLLIEENMPEQKGGLCGPRRSHPQ